jgi:hypothetical protein
VIFVSCRALGRLFLPRLRLAAGGAPALFLVFLIMSAVISSETLQSKSKTLELGRLNSPRVIGRIVAILGKKLGVAVGKIMVAS